MCANKTAPCCVGCGGGMSPVDVAMAAQDGFLICMKCVMSRHRAVVAGHCVCPKKQRRPVHLKGAGREWDSCERCLGVIR